MALSNYGPPYLRSPACRVLFAGWESTTLALQHAGWRLAAEQDVEWGRLRLMMRFEPAKLTVVCEDVNHRFSMHGWADRDNLPVFVARYATSDLKVVEPMDPSAFFAIDATPHIVYEPPKSIDDFKLFATAQAKVRASGVKPSQVIGPFNPTHNPPKDRPGLYLRISKKTGEACWAFWNGQKWGLYADSKDRAMQRRHKTSKKRLPWFAFKGR